MWHAPLFCFVSFCHAEISKPLGALGIFIKPFLDERVGAMVWKLLIIEPFSQWKLNEIKTENCIGVWKHSWCWQKLALGESDLIEFNFTISRAKVWKILIFEWIFVVGNWNKLQKLSLEGKNKSVDLSMCSHLGQGHRLHTNYH